MVENIDMVIIGSSAIKKHLDYFRTPNDVDCFATTDVPGFDTIIVPQELIDLIPKDDTFFASLDAVFTIKCSHLGWDIKWQKHKSDVLFLKGIGCKIIPTLYRALINFWKIEHKNKPYLSLYATKEQFFNDFVSYKIDHDELHEIVAYPNKPVYTLCLKENQEIAIDFDKFNMLSLDLQKQMFREEITVIAIERWLMNHAKVKNFSIQKAYSLAVHKTIVSLTKNWATEFLIEHLDYFVRFLPEPFNRFLHTTTKGKQIMSNHVVTHELINEIIHEFNKLPMIIKSPSNAVPELTEGSSIDTAYWTILEGSCLEIGYEVLEQDGGGEGGSESCYLIFKWKEQCYRLSYSYYSYQGYELDHASLMKVTPIQKMMTVYE